MFAAVGRSSVGFLEEFGRLGHFLADTLRALPDVRTWGRQLFPMMRRIGVDSLPIALFISAFTGIVLALLASYIFTAAVPISLEWEGMSEGPLEEADLARQWLERYPATPLRPFLHLFLAHRLRAGYEAARRENAKGLWSNLAKRYQKEIAVARSSPNELIACLAEDLEAQPHVYLAGFGHP